MLENPKLLYIVVEDGQRAEGGKITSFRYTRSLLQSTLQLMGCKARHAFKISKRVFEVMKNGFPGDFLSSNELDASEQDSLGSSADKVNDDYLGHTDDDENWIISKTDKRQDMPFELYKKRTTVTVDRTTFLDVVCESLSTYKYVGPNQRADLILACRIRERKESVTVLLCGTSGCGKSTLSSLLGSRLGITTVVSTDSIRHMMRSFVDEKQNPLLWASTYHAGDYLDPMAVAEAKTKRKAKKLTGSSPVPPKDDDCSSSGAQESTPFDAAACAELIGVKQMAVEGFKAQSEMVIDSLDRLISAWEDRNESVIVEGVHLSLNFVMGLMKKHPSIIPFMIHIANEDKHLERFAVRAKYMTLDPAKNKYVKYIRNIRTIQEYLCNRADKHLVPKINNTNVDKSVAAIHATVFSCLRRRAAGDQLYDPATNTVSVITDEFRNQCAANSLSSKGMFQLIQRKGSSRHLMALLNNDGSVAKVWPLETLDSDKPSSVVRQMSGPLQIGKAEPVNLQFGSFGISAWPGDAAGTSYAVSGDDSKAETAETGSRHLSSCASSPRYSDGPAKELKEELSVSVSEEEAEDITEEDSDEDLSDNEEKNVAEEMEGSVDEDGARSDEEYQDLAIYDEQENGYDTENEEDFDDRNMDGDDDKYQQNLDLFLSSTTGPTNAKCSDISTSHGRSQSIPALGKYGSLTSEPILSGALTR